MRIRLLLAFLLACAIGMATDYGNIYYNFHTGNVRIGSGYHLYNAGTIYNAGTFTNAGTMQAGDMTVTKLTVSDSIRVAKTMLVTGRADFTKRVDIDTLYFGGSAHVQSWADSMYAVHGRTWPANGAFWHPLTDTLILPDSVTWADSSGHSATSSYTDSARVAVTAWNTRGHDVIVDDSIYTSGDLYANAGYFGSGTKISYLSGDAIQIVSGADSTLIVVENDTVKVNCTTTTQVVKIGKKLVNQHAVVETLDVTGWGQADYWTVDTFVFGGSVLTNLDHKADTTGRPACIFGNSKAAGGDDTVDTLVNTGISATSIAILTPAFNAAGLVYIAGIAEDSLFIGYTDAADSTGARVYGCNYWIKE